MSGIEVAGIVLATLPLCIETAKAYAIGVDTLCNVALKQRRDEKLSSFYFDFYLSISELNLTMETIVHGALANSSRPASMLDIGQWNEESEVAHRLKHYFNNDVAYHHYIVVTERVAKLLAQLIEGGSGHITKESVEEPTMFNKLLAFALDRNSNTTESDFIERFRFFRKEKHRNQCLVLLKDCNERLRGTLRWIHEPVSFSVTIPIPPPPGGFKVPWNGLVLSIKDPRARVRILTRTLYSVLQSRWNCACDEVHEARICLNLHSSKKSVVDMDAEFELLIGATSGSWKESTVGVRASRKPLVGDDHLLVCVCDAARSCVKALQLRLLMEDIDGQYRLSRLKPQPKQTSRMEGSPHVSLSDILLTHTKLGPYEKRELAIVCAYSLLLLYGSDWLTRTWDKTCFSFFYNLKHEPEFARPFITTRFQSPAQTMISEVDQVFHRNSHVFALGILFIEILNEKPIECWRTSEEAAEVTPQTEAQINFVVADRIVRKMDNTPSRSAIEACLTADWVEQDKDLTLEDPDIRERFLKAVIQPLESEIATVSRENL